MLSRDDDGQLKARLCLEDARLACDEAVQAGRTGDRVLFRRRWVAAVSLLRSVGYVLDKADGPVLNPHLADRIARVWSARKNDKIFVHFIDKSRNLALKEYRSGVVADGGCSPMSNLKPYEDFPADTPLALANGEFEGSPIEYVFGLALEWWDDYLAEVEAVEV